MIRQTNNSTAETGIHTQPLPTLQYDNRLLMEESVTTAM